MKRIIPIFIGLLLFPALVFGGEKEATYLKEKMIPLAQEFLQRVGMTNDLPLKTNQVLRYKVDYFSDGRSGCMADMRLTNMFSFSLITERSRTEVWAFHQHVKTYYALEDAPKEKIAAVKALNLRNKLNETNALELGKKYFKLQGHEEKNFHSPTIHQCYWVGKGDVWGALPYYEIEWYRKDVNLADRDKGIQTLPEVSMTVSGVDSSLIYYLKSNLPIGSDF